MEKKQKTPEQIYKSNQAKSKFLKDIAPIVYWACIGLAIFCVIMALSQSFGNMTEIINKLDSKIYTGEELRANYDELINKYGEWVIGTGSTGFTITFINISKALFSGIMITDCVLALVFFISAGLWGKWLLPKLSDQLTQENQDMVNLTILKDKG